MNFQCPFIYFLKAINFAYIYIYSDIEALVLVTNCDPPSLSSGHFYFDRYN